jgi:hypothetical protein
MKNPEKLATLSTKDTGEDKKSKQKRFALILIDRLIDWFLFYVK